MDRREKEASVNASLTFLCAILVGIAGCASKGDRIEVALPSKVSNAAPASSDGPRIAVLPFDDKRVGQIHLGQRAHLWGGTTYFDLSNGTVSTASSQALVDYLNRQGWRASFARTQGSEGADVTILATIQDLSIDATSWIMHTDLSAKSTIALQIINHSDDSMVMERVSGSGADQVLWFESEDAQALIGELLESNFKKFINDVQINGGTIRLK
jgi:hypothetical protein